MTEHLQENVKSAVSRLVRANTIPKAGTSISIAADKAQRSQLAEFHGLLDVTSFEADLLAEAWQLDGVRLTGRVRSNIVQKCIVTLEPVDAQIDTQIDVILLPEDRQLKLENLSAGELVLEAEGPDEPDTFSGDHVDVGAIAEEFFALAIDPYPRRPGAKVEEKASEETGVERPSPFAKLAELKRHNPN